MRRTLVLLLVGFSGCALFAKLAPGTPSETYVWDDAAPLIKLPRADAAEAAGVVLAWARAHQWFQSDVCLESSRAWAVDVAEAKDVFQVYLSRRPGLCRVGPEETVLPPVLAGSEAAAVEFAVSKADLRIIRIRRPGDEATGAEEASTADGGAAPDPASLTPSDGGQP